MFNPFAYIYNAFVEVFTPTQGAIVRTYYNINSPKQGPGMDVIPTAYAILKAQLQQREGLSFSVYPDPKRPKGTAQERLAYATGGIGHLLTAAEKAGHLDTGWTISQKQVTDWFKADSDKALNAGLAQAQDLGMYDPNMIAALANVQFQLGGKFSATGEFKNSYARLKNKKFSELYSALRQSLWYSQTPERVNDFIAAVDKWRVLNKYTLDGKRAEGNS